MTLSACSPMGVLESVLPTARDLLFCLDFDGTLAPITQSPYPAATSRELDHIVRTLAALPEVTVAVVSGRSAADLRRRFDQNIICLGCHGLEMESEDLKFRHERAVELAGVVNQAAWDLEAAVLNLPSVFLERKGLCATLHYHQAPPYLAEWLESTVEWTLRPYR